MSYRFSIGEDTGYTITNNGQDVLLQLDGSLTILNNLTVNGTTTTIDTQNVLVDDVLMILGTGNSGTSFDLGLIFQQNSGADNKGIIWDSSGAEFAFINTLEDGTTEGNVTIASYADIHANDVTANNITFTGTITGSLVLALDDLIDVDTTTLPPAQASILSYRSGEWVPTDVVEGIVGLGLNIEPFDKRGKTIDLKISGLDTVPVDFSSSVVIQDSDTAIKDCVIELIGGANSDRSGIIWSTTASTSVARFFYDHPSTQYEFWFSSFQGLTVSGESLSFGDPLSVAEYTLQSLSDLLTIDSNVSIELGITGTPVLTISAGGISANSNIISDVNTPVLGTDAANKTYVDDVVGSGVANLDDVLDVDLTGAADNDLLYRSGGNWVDTAGDLSWDGSTLTISGLIQTSASASGSAGINLPHGTAPAAPVDGDIWTTTLGAFARINGVTVELSSSGASTLGDLSDVVLTGASDNDLLYRSGGNWIDTAGDLNWDGSVLRVNEIANATGTTMTLGSMGTTAINSISGVTISALFTGNVTINPAAGGFAEVNGFLYTDRLVLSTANPDVSLERVSANVVAVRQNGSDYGAIVSGMAVNAQVGTTYTLLSTDTGYVITLNNASPITLTVPDGLPQGFNVVIVQLGAGQVTVNMSGTDNLNSAGGLTSLSGQHSTASLIKYTATDWNLAGDLA